MKKLLIMLMPILMVGCKEPECNVECKGYGCVCVEDDRPECSEDATDLPDAVTLPDAVSPDA